MKISKRLEWLYPYLDAVEDVIPRFKKMESIRTIRSSKTKRDRTMGELCLENGTYTLKLRAQYQHLTFGSKLSKVDVKLCKLSKIDILCTLAHELAHMYHWDHTPEHKLLECQLLTIFMYKLKSLGYISEEESE